MSKNNVNGVHWNQRGDTIVEVMIAIAVLGAVLGGAYVISGRSVKTNTASQERLQAVKLTEAQFEKLKILSTTETEMFDWNDFCLNGASEKFQSSSDQCYVDSTGASADPQTVPRYHIVTTGIPFSTAGLSGTRFKVTVTWESFVNSGLDRVDQYYEVYR